MNPDPYETNIFNKIFMDEGAYIQYMINGPKNLVGSFLGETLYGAPLGGDYIHAMGGDDTIYPDDFGSYIGVGSDIVFGGQGNDTVFAGGGNDRIFGDEGTGDQFSMFGNKDTLYGENGNDFLYGGEGGDILYGGGGADVFAIQKDVGEESAFGLGGIMQGELTNATRIMDYDIYQGDYLFYDDNPYDDLSQPFNIGSFNPMSSFFEPLKVAYGVYTDYSMNNWATLYTDEFIGVEVLAHITTPYGSAPTISDLDFVTTA